MTVIIAPTPLTDATEQGLFLAGGISGCPDWQAEIIPLLDDVPAPLYNPRRSDYVEGPEVGLEQIEWEFNALNQAGAVLFWFPSETLCPITLFELGRFSHQKDMLLFVGTHPDYQRRFDVVTQLKLARPDVVVYDAVESLAAAVVAHYRKGII